LGGRRNNNGHAIAIPDILNEILVSWKAGITIAVERQRELKCKREYALFKNYATEDSHVKWDDISAIDLGRKIQYIYLHDHLPSLSNELRIIISKR
jgi:hypothetical protein